jgi:hypothetical protein
VLRRCEASSEPLFGQAGLTYSESRDGFALICSGVKGIPCPPSRSSINLSTATRHRLSHASKAASAMVWGDSAVSREYFTALSLLQTWARRIASSAALSAQVGVAVRAATSAITIFISRSSCSPRHQAV